MRMTVERHLVSVDFGFEHIQCAVNACMAGGA